MQASCHYNSVSLQTFSSNAADDQLKQCCTHNLKMLSAPVILRYECASYTEAIQRNNYRETNAGADVRRHDYPVVLQGLHVVQVLQEASGLRVENTDPH